MQKTSRGHRPRLTIVIGTNGAGKSTWCSKHEDELPAAFYDADSIANSLGDWNDPRDQIQAARHVNGAIRDHLARRESFGFESTYSWPSRARLKQVVASVPEFVIGRNGDRGPKLYDFARESIGGLVAPGEFRDGRGLGRHRSELARQHSLTLAIDVFASCELTLLQSNVSAAQVGHDPPVGLTPLGLVGSWGRRTGSDAERRACCLNQLLHRGLSLPALLSGVSRTRNPKLSESAELRPSNC